MSVLTPEEDALRRLCASQPAAQWRGPLAQDAWLRLADRAADHGLAGRLHLLLRGERTSEAPDAARETCRAAYVKARMRHAGLTRQLREIEGALERSGRRAVVLKGALALPDLYTDPGTRGARDLDILAPEADTGALADLLAGLGYRAERAVYTSPEEERVQARLTHLAPFVRPGRLPIEVHIRLFAGSASGAAAEEAWRRAEPLPGSEAILRLCPADFLLYGALHLARHVRDGGVQLKWVADLLLALEHWGEALCWPEFWRTVERWGVRERVAPVLATLAAGWDLPAGAQPPGGSEPLSWSLLAAQGGDPRGALAARFGAARELPGLGARARYLFRLVIPSAAHMRQRYQLQPGESLRPSYRHYFRQCASRLRRRPASMSGE